MESPTNSLNSQDCAPELARRLGVILLGLAGLVAWRFLKNPRMVGIIVPLWRRLLQWSPLAIFLILCLPYGFFFALTAPYLIVQFTFPILLLAAVMIWALPDMRHPPTGALSRKESSVAPSRTAASRAGSPAGRAMNS